MPLKITQDKQHSNRQFRATLPPDEPDFVLVDENGVVQDDTLQEILASAESGDNIYIELTKNKNVTVKG